MRNVGSIRGGVLVMLFLFVASHAAVLYVGPGGYSTIQAGLDACSAGDIVIVAQGTYYENVIWPNVQSIQLLSEGGPIFVKIDGGTAASVIQITTGVDSTTVINGFQIRNGYAGSGGGIYCVNSSPTISNNALHYNEAIDSSGGGGAIYCFNSSPVITGNHVAQNDAAGSGGAIYCENNSSPTIADNAFFSNESFSGGAICLDASSPLIVNNSFSANGADSIGGGICGRNSSSPTITENVMYNNYSQTFSFSSGGAIVLDSNCVATITKNTIQDNYADSAVGGIGCYSGVIADNVITENRAGFAAGIGIGPRGSVTITNNTITNNAAYLGGGGIVCGAHSTSMIRDNIISDNSGEFAGGGIICDSAATPTIRRNTITNNAAPGFFGTGAGIRCSDTAAPIIDSCIISGNTGDVAIYCTDAAVPSIHHNEIENNSEGGVENADGSVTVDATNNWWGDPSGPGGAGPGSGDEVSNYVDYDPWRLKSTIDSISPARPFVFNVKAGDNAELTWNAITTDTLGNSETMDHYVVYRSSSPSFIPGASDSIGAVSHPETTYTDVGAVVAESSYYYLVKAVDWKKNKSKRSNMVYVFHKIMNENPLLTDKNRASRP